MRNLLFEHNQKAYQSAVEMMARTGKAAVVHPTGTGKSFIAFQLCADNARKKIVWLSPSEYIFATQVEKWHLAGGKKLKNVQFITYARLMRMEGEEMTEIRPDYIILDEFHRCGARQWGEGVERLREMYPKAFVLGLSATSVRYLDNQRDMSWELFDGNIASELTLGAAVARGILPTPKYVLSIYSYQKELRQYEERVRQTKGKAVRDAAEKELEALRRALEKADGLAEVFARHMRSDKMEALDYGFPAKAKGNFEVCMGNVPKREQSSVNPFPQSGSKYIVFCANYEHLLKMRALAAEWFAKVDASPHIYTAYSDNPETSVEFEAFKTDKSAHLKLLYCIDMLNEGIHVDGVDGVILLRPTVSPTIYKQQIGRALAAGSKGSPVIFDIVMNIENLCSIGAIEEELQEAVLFYRADGREKEIVNEHFRVIDELGDCRKLFVQLNEILGASWETMYRMAQEYFAEYRNLEIPATYVTPEGYSLGAWIGTQRKVHAGKVAGVLTKEQIARLTEIGMRWQSAPEAAWEKNFAEAERYFQEHGDLAVPKRYVAGSGKKLGIWLQRQRTGRKSGQLTGRQVAKLDMIGMVWEIGNPWEKGFLHAQEYFWENGHLEVPNGYVCEDGYRLGKWISNQRSRYGGKGTEEKKVQIRAEKETERNIETKGKVERGLSQEEIKRLEEIGMVWSAKVGRRKG